MTNKEIAKAWFAAIDRKDFTTIISLAHPDHRFINPMTPEPANTEMHLGMMQMMANAFTGAHQLELILGDENHVAVRARYQATHTGDFNGVPPTGKQVEFTFTDIFEIVDGKVRQEILEMNPATMMHQIGAVTANT